MGALRRTAFRGRSVGVRVGREDVSPPRPLPAWAPGKAMFVATPR